MDFAHFYGSSLTGEIHMLGLENTVLHNMGPLSFIQAAGIDDINAKDQEYKNISSSLKANESRM